MLKSSIFPFCDILAWVKYIAKIYAIENEENSILILKEAFVHGLQTVFIDALDFIAATNVEKLEVEHNKNTLKFGITPFFSDINQNGPVKTNEFSFSAPTTKKNLFRVLSALSLNKAILLEGPPGVGKSSLIENIANAIGSKHRENQSR
jgi:midasin